MRRILKLTFASWLLFWPASSLVAQVQHHDWVTSLSSDKSGVYAANTNTDCSVLMESCFVSSKTCSWMMTGDSICEKYAKMPALVNADSYGRSINLTCGGKLDGGSYLYEFSDWKGLESLISVSKYVGIAMALGNTRFKVFRFSLFGMTEAKDQAEQALKIMLKSQNGNPASDDRKTTNAIY